MAKPAYNERIQWSPNASNRSLNAIDYGALHTQQGNGTAASLANYLCNPSSQVSYHYTVDNDRNVVAVVDTDRSSWSVGNANHRVINVCFAGSYAEWTRQEWLGRMGNGIEIAAYLLVLDCKKYPRIDPVVRSHDDIRAGKRGLTDHRGINVAVLNAKGHWDVGDGFPWDIFAAHVKRFAEEGTEQKPDVTAIEACHAANEWLGKKVSQNREETPIDGVGRFAHYENGSIYWHPDADPSGAKRAFAITKKIFGKYSIERWELGYLGYPAGPHLVLKDFTKSDGTLVRGGDVQSFQGGTIYEQDGDDSPGYVVRDAIRDQYSRQRYEMGPLGWPQSDETPFGDSTWGGFVQRFDYGRIYWFREGGSTVAFLDGSPDPLPPISGPVAVPDTAPKPAVYVPSADEQKLTPKSINGLDPMVGGISWFAGPKDASTRGRNMGISMEPADRPKDDWYCAMRFGYVGLVPRTDGVFAPGVAIKPADNIGMSQTEKFRLKDLLPNLRLKVTNLANGKQIVVRPADWGPGIIKPYRVIDVSERAEKTLEATTDSQVRVEWCDPSTPLGPVN